MKVVYDSHQHLHIGYYDNAKDIEAIAYKRENEDIWDIFLDFEDQNLTKVNSISNYIKYFGYKIFSVKEDDLSFETGHREFENWLLKHKYIKDKSNL